MAEGEFKYKEPPVKKPEGPTLYQIIGVSPKASKNEIEKGYRDMAKRVHPDLGDAAEKKARNESMQKLSAAKDELLDPVKRANYDSHLEKIEAERIKQERAEASERAYEEKRKTQREEDERRRVAVESEERKRQEDEKLKREAERLSKEELERRRVEEQEAKKREEDEKAKKRGYDLGEKLSAWIYTDEGRAEEKRLKDLLTWASKKQEGILAVFESQDERARKIDSLVMDMVNGNSLETWGYGVDLARYIRNRWEGEGLEEDQVKSRFSKLERQLIEIAHAKQYDDEGNYNRDRAVPVNLEPGSYRHRYDYNTAKIWNRQLYVIGFKEGWKKIKGLRG